MQIVGWLFLGIVALGVLYTVVLRTWHLRRGSTKEEVRRALPGDELMDYVNDIAGHLATQVSPRSVAIMKRQVRESYFQSYAASLEVADAEMEASFATHDFKEGVASFVERRPPAFTGK